MTATHVTMRGNPTMEPRKSFVTVLFALALSGSVLAASNISPSELLGVWKEKNRDVSGSTITYTFQNDHEFEFTQFPEDGSSSKNPGAWQMGRDICRINDTGTKGNLMIHLGTDRCCHLAYFLGKNLILSNVSGERSSWSVCADRVLVREK